MCRYCTFAALLLSALPVGAQTAPMEAPCPYSECAIRIEQRFFGGLRIVRGVPGDEVEAGSVGWLSGRLADYVAASPDALAHARSARGYQIGSLASAVAGGIAIGVSVAHLDPDDPTIDLLYVAGVGLALVSGVLQLNAQRQQARAVWEYNRTLVPAP